MTDSCIRRQPKKGAVERAAPQSRLPNAQGIKNYVAHSSSSFGRLLQGTFQFQTHEEAERLSAMLALNTPFPERASMGFWELLSNAIEHGNLGIEMDLKTELLIDGRFVEEIERRRNQAAYRDRFATAEFKTEPHRILLKVTDQGEGFDYEKMMKADLAGDRPNGRGIALARQICFDRLEYFGAGNVVEGSIVVE